MCNDVAGIAPARAAGGRARRRHRRAHPLSSGRDARAARQHRHRVRGRRRRRRGRAAARRGRRDVAGPRSSAARGSRSSTTTLRVQAERRTEVELGSARRARQRRASTCTTSRSCPWRAGVLGVEALARFTHPSSARSRRRVHPVAEETDLILPLGICGPRQGVRAGGAVAGDTTPRAEDLYVAVNLSGRQLYDPQLVSQVQRVLHPLGARARRAVARDHRERADGRRRRRGADLRATPRARRAPRRRRLRHRLLVARVPAGASRSRC